MMFKHIDCTRIPDSKFIIKNFFQVHHLKQSSLQLIYFTRFRKLISFCQFHYFDKDNILHNSYCPSLLTAIKNICLNTSKVYFIDKINKMY